MVGKKRSPKYPFIPLDKALDRAREFYDKEGMHAASVSVAVSHWGYNPKSSGGLQTISALKGYGLMEDEGRGPSRKLKLTEHAKRILLDQRTGSIERDKLIEEAALTPPLFQEIWLLWEMYGRMSDENMRHMLIFDKHFNENSVDDLIRVFKETVEFAKLEYSDSMSFKDEAKSEMAEEAPRKQVRNAVEIAYNLEPNMNEDTFTLEEGRIILRWPANLSKDSCEDFESWLNLILKKAKRAAGVSDKDESSSEKKADKE